MTDFPTEKIQAMARLKAFVPNAGKRYAQRRNFDHGAGRHKDVSCLSPYVRRRIITETEVLHAVLGAHAYNTAEKFIQEVFWRTYWKGWLEMRPSVWRDYQKQLGIFSSQIATQSGLRQQWEAACLGDTGIDCFDAWAHELVTTGYLHNHARMWFASIWIFTLQLPWQLGADFFLRHLLDGDPASNTLSWRWVAGLQTAGKTYLARPDNIAKFTNGRFFQSGLATSAQPVGEFTSYPRLPAPVNPPFDKAAPTLLMLHDEDTEISQLVDSFENIIGAVRINCLNALTPFEMSRNVTNFVGALIQDTDERWSTSIGSVENLQNPADILTRALDGAAIQIATPYAPVGPTADVLKTLSAQAEQAGVKVIPVLSHYDEICWPKATHGFFRFKEHIGQFLSDLKISA